jgi:60kDa lysophospholipase
MGSGLSRKKKPAAAVAGNADASGDSGSASDAPPLGWESDLNLHPSIYWPAKSPLSSPRGTPARRQPISVSGSGDEQHNVTHLQAPGVGQMHHRHHHHHHHHGRNNLQRQSSLVRIQKAFRGQMPPTGAVPDHKRWSSVIDSSVGFSSGDVEVRVVHADPDSGVLTEHAIGALEVNASATVQTFRAKLVEEVDDVPPHYVFLFGTTGIPVGRKQEKSRLLTGGVLRDGVIRIMEVEESKSSLSSPLPNSMVGADVAYFHLNPENAERTRTSAYHEAHSSAGTQQSPPDQTNATGASAFDIAESPSSSAVVHTASPVSNKTIQDSSWHIPVDHTTSSDTHARNQEWLRLTAKSAKIQPVFAQPSDMRVGHGPIHSSNSLGKSILMIYTGGTIGMRPGKNGYEPAHDFFYHFLRSSPTFQDPFVPVVNNVLTTPLSRFGKRFQYTIVELDPLLDSSNMTTVDWIKIAQVIEENYDEFGAFIVLHGTDTIAYTASALSFMLQDLDKTVVLTGSQVPISEPQTDAVDNLLGAICMAGHYDIPEVLLCFNQKVFRGNRVTKHNTESFEAYLSANYEPMAEIGTHVNLRWELLRNPPVNGKFSVWKTLNSNVTLIRLFPGISPTLMRKMMEPPVAGVILQTYGAGNGPDNDPDFLLALYEASQRGVVIVNISQCMKGKVSAEYAAGSALVRAGVVPGVDLTVEAAYAKLAYLLGREPDSPDEVRRLMQCNLRGELSLNDENRFSVKDVSFVKAVAQALSLPDAKTQEHVAQSLGPIVLCTLAESGDLTDLKSLVEAGLDPDRPDYDKRTPLHMAATAGQFAVVQYLIEREANVNALDRWGETPLQRALSGQHYGVVKLLKNCGAILKGPNIPYMMAEAASYGEAKRIRQYLDAGFDPKVRVFNGNTLLHVAAAENQMEVIQVLLENGVDPQTKNDVGTTPLDVAQSGNHRDAKNLMLHWTATHRHHTDTADRVIPRSLTPAV